MSEAPGPLLRELLPGTLDCVHCGLCLPACPTYRISGREGSSPRGRIALMRAAAEGRIPLAGGAAEEAALCLGCRACETACPSGVAYGQLLEQARHALVRAGLRRGPGPWLERQLLRHLVPRPARLRAAVTLLAALQRLGLDRLARPLLPSALRQRHELLPQIPDRSERRHLPPVLPAAGRRRGRVALLEGCIMPELFGRVNRITAELLARNGFEVVVPAGQGCCGALQAHAGEMELARELGRRNLRAFQLADVDAVLSNSAGCGAALRELHHWLPGEGEPLASAARDVCEFLDQEGLVAPPPEQRLRVCYDDPCHLLHGQGVSEAPRRLLRQVPGLELVPHAAADACCGAAGTYNLLQPEMSRAILDRKLDALAAADPDLVATGNPGCLLQLAAGLRRRGLRTRAVHPVELL